MVAAADLAPSNMTLMKMYGDFQKNQYQEKNLRFGVREHGMGAICNGIFVHNDGMIPYCATFFNFTDYMRAAIRMSALSRVSHPFYFDSLPQHVCRQRWHDALLDHLPQPR